MTLPTTAFVSRLAPDSGDSDKEGYASHPGFPSGVRCNIQPATPEVTAMSDGVFGKTYTAFIRTSGVVEGMKLTVSGTNEEYIVRGRANYNYGVEQHQELTLFKSDRNVP